MPAVNILVLFNGDDQLCHGEASDGVATAAVREAAAGIAAAAARSGHEVQLLAAPEEPGELIATLRAVAPEVVFNLVEALRGQAHFEAAVAWLLELAGLAYTGSPPRALALALEKPVTRAVLIRAAEIRARYGLRAPDAIMLATAVESGATLAVTNDSAWRKVDEIEVLLLRDLKT